MGKYSKIYLVELQTNKTLYAMKVFRKDILIDSNFVQNVTQEKNIMKEVDYPFLINLLYMFHNDYRIYFLMPYIQGGELFQYHRQQKRFSEDIVKFYAV